MSDLMIGDTTVISENSGTVSFPGGTFNGTVSDSITTPSSISNLSDSDGYFVTAFKPRYISNWFNVTLDDSYMKGYHGLDPIPEYGRCQLALPSYLSVIHVLGWPTTEFNSNDDDGAFAFDETHWALQIDDDLSYKKMNPKTTETSSISYPTGTGYAFRVILF